MALEKDTIEAEAVENSSTGNQKHGHATDFEAPATHVQELSEAQHVNLSWRTWVVVFVACFAIMAQVFVVVAAGSVIAFIIRDLGDGELAGWIIGEYHCESGLVGRMLIQCRGTVADAERSIANGRPLERRTRSQVYGYDSSHCGFRWCGHIGQGDLNGHACRWWHPDWCHTSHHRHRTGYPQ